MRRARRLASLALLAATACDAGVDVVARASDAGTDVTKPVVIDPPGERRGVRSAVVRARGPLEVRGGHAVRRRPEGSGHRGDELRAGRQRGVRRRSRGRPLVDDRRKDGRRLAQDGKLRREGLRAHPERDGVRVGSEDRPRVALRGRWRRAPRDRSGRRWRSRGSDRSPPRSTRFVVSPARPMVGCSRSRAIRSSPSRTWTRPPPQ